jgi:hypothetical protein
MLLASGHVGTEYMFGLSHGHDFPYSLNTWSLHQGKLSEDIVLANLLFAHPDPTLDDGNNIKAPNL